MLCSGESILQHRYCSYLNIYLFYLSPLFFYWKSKIPLWYIFIIKYMIWCVIYSYIMFNNQYHQIINYAMQNILKSINSFFIWKFPWYSPSIQLQSHCLLCFLPRYCSEIAIDWFIFLCFSCINGIRLNAYLKGFVWFTEIVHHQSINNYPVS